MVKTDRLLPSMTQTRPEFDLHRKSLKHNWGNERHTEREAKLLRERLDFREHGRVLGKCVERVEEGRDRVGIQRDHD